MSATSAVSSSTDATVIYVRTLRNQTLAIDAESIGTIAELKESIYLKHDIPVKAQQIFLHGHLLKDSRTLSHYKLASKVSKEDPLLLTELFNIDVFISKKVLSLYALTASEEKDKYEQALIDAAMPSQHSIECNSSTTVTSILKQLKLNHLAHLLKVCVGAGNEDIRDMSKKIVDVPGVLSEGIISVLFSARWFIDRTMDMTNISASISNVIQKSNAASKTLKACISFGRLNYHFEKAQAFILSEFEKIDRGLQEQTTEITNASKWFKKVMENNHEQKVDEDAEILVFQLENKVDNLETTLKSMKRKWIKKRKQIVLYLQKSVRETEVELMKHFRTWIASDIVQWLQYMDERIMFDDDIVSKFVTFNINGYNLSDVNDLSLKLMGIANMETRQLIIGYIDTLLQKFGDGKAPHSPYCHGSCCSSPASDTSCDSDHSNNNVCCICATNQVSTVIVPCGHSTYCNECSQESIKHSNRCPICRQQVTSIITVFKAGLQFAEN
eukprot:CAMPEP_0197073568 /NCGR_PEP_ID=MMETSP1384-20130603/210669_1 /TAXON_ID=29189 /ORGANISM="Ammonia sp." /LENGTH=498 /DNA_ID=CAMNT_0042512405 /DNA_START=67 /DNA_END=1563 /DNA_ORIENTATION=+